MQIYSANYTEVHHIETSVCCNVLHFIHDGYRNLHSQLVIDLQWPKHWPPPTLPADLWITTANPIVWSLVPLSGSLRQGDIIIIIIIRTSSGCCISLTSCAVPNGGVELVKGACE